MRETRPRPQPGADPRSTRERLENGPVALHAGRVGNRGPREDAAQGGPRPPRAAGGGGNGRSELEPTRRDGGRSGSPAVKALVAGGVAGGLATGLWALARAGRGLPPVHRSLPVEGRLYRWRGHRVIFYRRGEGPPVVLVHAIHAAASAREMREPFERLAADHTVFAFDLLGFGASDRPPLRYTAALYVDLLADFLREVVAEPAVVVASSLSAAHALAAARRTPGQVRALVLVNPTGMATLADGRGPAGRLVERLFRSPVVGEALFHGLVSRPSLRHYGHKTYGDRRLVDRSLISAQYRTSHQRGAHWAPAAFLGGALDRNVERDLAALTVPALVVWTPCHGFQDTEAESRAYASVNPHLESRVILGSGALPHDEKPEEFEALVREWLGRIEPRL